MDKLSVLKEIEDRQELMKRCLSSDGTKISQAILLLAKAIIVSK